MLSWELKKSPLAYESVSDGWIKNVFHSCDAPAFGALHMIFPGSVPKWVFVDFLQHFSDISTARSKGDPYVVTTDTVSDTHKRPSKHL